MKFIINRAGYCKFPARIKKGNNNDRQYIPPGVQYFYVDCRNRDFVYCFKIRMTGVAMLSNELIEIKDEVEAILNKRFDVVVNTCMKDRVVFNVGKKRDRLFMIMEAKQC